MISSSNPINDPTTNIASGIQSNSSSAVGSAEVQTEAAISRRSTGNSDRTAMGRDESSMAMSHQPMLFGTVKVSGSNAAAVHVSHLPGQIAHGPSPATNSDPITEYETTGDHRNSQNPRARAFTGSSPIPQLYDPPMQQHTFPTPRGHTLAARYDTPDTTPVAHAIFAHCFTCSKDIPAAHHIAKGLVAQGIAVLRFDFTGLGHSDGEFANENFSSNVEDILAAADSLAEHGGPDLLIGHSLGGAGVLGAAAQIDSVKAVATIGAPADPGHVAHLFGDHLDEIEQRGEARVSLAGRPFTVKKQFLEDIAEQNLTDRIAHLKRALLVMHAPTDATVGIDNATRIFTAAKHPKSFVSLDDADHLLTTPRDARYAADVIAAWARRYVIE